MHGSGQARALCRSRSLSSGLGLSGEVVAVGPEVSDLRAGDRVYGVTNPQFVGAYAEYALAKAGMIATRPASLTSIEAASVLHHCGHRMAGLV